MGKNASTFIFPTRLTGCRKSVNWKTGIWHFCMFSFVWSVLIAQGAQSWRELKTTSQMDMKKIATRSNSHHASSWKIQKQRRRGLQVKFYSTAPKTGHTHLHASWRTTHRQVPLTLKRARRLGIQVSTTGVPDLVQTNCFTPQDHSLMKEQQTIKRIFALGLPAKTVLKK